MALSVRKTKLHPTVACLAAVMLLASSGTCFGQADVTTSANVEVPATNAAPGEAPVAVPGVPAQIAAQKAAPIPASEVTAQVTAPIAASEAAAQITAPIAASEATAQITAPIAASEVAPQIAIPVAASDFAGQPPCSSVVLNCNPPARDIAPEHQLLDPATARDQAQRAQAQADQTAAEEQLQRRIEFARQHPNAIFVYGEKSAPKESVSDVFNRALGVSTPSLTTSTFDSMGRRTECVNACHGPACCVTTTSAVDYGK